MIEFIQKFRRWNGILTVLSLLFLLGPGAKLWADTYYFTTTTDPTLPGTDMITNYGSLPGGYSWDNLTAPLTAFANPASSCTYNSGAYSVILIPWGFTGASNVTVALNIVNSSTGSVITSIGSETQNLNSFGSPGSQFTAPFYFPSGSQAIDLGQEFQIIVSSADGTPVSISMPSSTAFAGTGMFTEFTTPPNSCDTPTATYTPQPSCAVSGQDLYLMTTSNGVAYPPGEVMQTASPPSTGASWVTVPSGPSSMVFYGPPEIGTFYQAVADLYLAARPATGYEPVSVTIGYANLDGTGYTQMGGALIDFDQTGYGGTGNSGGPGNYNLNYNTATLNNQMLVLTFQNEGAIPVSLLYGTSFYPDNLLMGPMVTAGCVGCPVTEQIERSSTSDLLSHVNNETSFPSGWTTFTQTQATTNGFVPASLWTTPTGPYFNPADTWMSWAGVAGVVGSDGDSSSDMNLIVNDFTIPTGALNIEGMLYLSVDDYSSSWMNGTVIQTDPAGTITNQLPRTFPVSGFTAGANNVLAIENDDAAVSFLGYEYELDIFYQMPCVSVTPTYTITNTATNTPTMTPGMTSTFTQTPTMTSTSTSTNSPTLTLTSTITNTATNTPIDTVTATPTPNLYVWPNPFNPSYGTGTLKVGYLDQGAVMSIYTISGELVISSTDNSPELVFQDGYMIWDGRNTHNLYVSTGVYYYIIQNKGKTILVGKLLVITGK